MCSEDKENAPVGIIYTNWKGVTSWRTIIPVRHVFKSSEWHGAGKHHILEAIDIEKGESRDFLLRDIRKFDTSEIEEKTIMALVNYFNSAKRKK